MSAMHMMTIIASIALLTVLIVLAFKKKRDSKSESESEEENYQNRKYGKNFKVGGFGLPRNWR